MKTFSVLFTTVLALLFCLHSTTGAALMIQNQEQEQQQRRRAMPGGYALAQIDSPQVVSAASFAVSSLSESPYSFASNVMSAAETADEGSVVVKVAKAWQQVVAGMNFRLVIIVENNSTGECIGSFTATVYDHFGSLSVTKWGKEVTCDQAKGLLEQTTLGSSAFENDDEDFNE
jgi:hypothetical protein